MLKMHFIYKPHPQIYATKLVKKGFDDKQGWSETQYYLPKSLNVLD